MVARSTRLPGRRISTEACNSRPGVGGVADLGVARRANHLQAPAEQVCCCSADATLARRRLAVLASRNFALLERSRAGTWSTMLRWQSTCLHASSDWAQEGGAGSEGAGAEGTSTGGASFGGARAKGTSTGGASSRGVGAVGTGTGGARTRAAAAGVVAAGAAVAGVAAATVAAAATTALEDTFAAAFPTYEWSSALGLPSSSSDHSPSPPAQGIPPPHSSPAVVSPPHSQHIPLVVPHSRVTLYPPRACPSSLVDDLRTFLLCSCPRRSPSQSVLPSPPESSLIVSSHPITDYYRAARPVVTLVLASLIMDPRASPSSVSALVANFDDFATIRCLEYATRVVAARPLSAEDESALGYDGDPDALDIPTPRTYREAVSGQWASQWIAAMEPEMASWRSTGTYDNAVAHRRPNVVAGMWTFKVKQPSGSPPVFKPRYVARGFSRHEGVDFFQTFVPTPKMITLQVLLHVATQRDYELQSLDFSTSFL
ncbi:unnamed protein product [Closterium sp. NIES-54]